MRSGSRVDGVPRAWARPPPRHRRDGRATTHRSRAQVEGKKADLARDPAAFTAVAIESDDDDDAPQETGFTKIQIADEDSSD